MKQLRGAESLGIRIAQIEVVRKGEAFPGNPPVGRCLRPYGTMRSQGTELIYGISEADGCRSNQGTRAGGGCQRVVDVPLARKQRFMKDYRGPGRRGNHSS